MQLMGSMTDKIIKDTSDSGDLLSPIIMDAMTTEPIIFLLKTWVTLS